MMKRIRLLFYLFLAISFCNVITIAQESSSGFLIGAFIAASDSAEYTLYNNYDQILDCGLNSVFQNAKKTDTSNLTQLSQFSFVYAANDTSPNHAMNDGNKDWVSYFTHAKYFKWEAEGDDNFPDDPIDNDDVGIRHNGVGEAKDGGWSSGTDTSKIDEFFIDGPFYTQYMKYVYTNRWLANDPISYIVNFSIKLAESQVDTFDVVKIFVTVDTSGVEVPLDSMEISTSQLGTVYKTFSLSYSYSSVAGEDSGTSGEYIPPPGLDWIPFDAPANQDWIDFTKKVRFKVQWLANAEVIVDYIEVYDQEIWEFYFKQNPDWMVDSISNYIDDFSTLGSKLKYFFTMDEPHSWDSFIPIKKIQDILTDTLNTDRELLVHFYPGWNNSRESMSVLDRWMDIAEPSQLNFWYAPFTNDENGIPHKREFTLSSLQGILQVAHEEQPKFFVTLQTFGVKNKDTGEYIHYMHPTEGEVRAETMLSLAHGVRGIYYEEYYSRPSVSPLLVENLVYGMDSSYSPMPLWYVVQDIASRLDGKLGSTLLSLDYTGNYLQLQYFIPSDDPVPTPPTYDYLTLGQNPSAEDMNWHAGLFVNSSHSDNKYFLLTNLLTTANKSVQVKVTEPVSGYDNYRFRNVEDGYFDTTFVTQIIKTLTHPKGEGYLYQVAPVVKYGGKLIANDTVDASINLVDDMIIRNGVNLLIDDGGYYTAEDTITLQGTGFITGDGYFDRDEYGWVVLNSWDYSVFKGRVGDHPKIIWSEHPTIQNIHSYRIYRDKGTSGWVPIKILPDSIFEYIDSTVTIVTGPPSQNEVTAYYFVAARIEEKEQIVNADSSNSILYRRVEGAGWEKRGTGEKGVRFTYSLGHNYPNPYNPSTTINYSLERSGLVELDVFDILGSRVALLVNEHREEGHHSVVFNATNLSSGIYFYRIKSGGFVQTKKMILIK